MANRYYYINKLYNKYIPRWIRKKQPTKKIEKEVKKQLEKFLMALFHEHYGGGKPRIVRSFDPVYTCEIWKPTLRDAYDYLDEVLHDTGAFNLFDNEKVEKWAKKNRKLLKMK